MKKYLLLMISPVLFGTVSVASTELPLTLTPEEKIAFRSKEYQEIFTQIPSNPNLRQAIPTYRDSHLTEVKAVLYPNQQFTIQSILVNEKEEIIFQLEDFSYIAADPSVIFDDQITEEIQVEKTYWLAKEFRSYSSPISNEAVQVSTTLKPYQAVHVSKIVKTPVDTFYQVGEKEWVVEGDLSQEDRRMEAVQALLDTHYHSDNFSIYVKQLSTQKVAGVNQDKKMYAASISKLPVLYYVQEKINYHQYDLSEGLQYIPEVTTFKGSYAPEGSGQLSKTADQHHYKISELMDKTAQLSDNAASNLLAYYITQQFDESYYAEMDQIIGERWDMQSRMASSEMAAKVMEKIYEQDGYVLQSLKTTQFDDQRIARDLPVPVAHKIGDAYDVKHDVAIVYTESPFILSIFTDQSDYETISHIANEIYEILK